MPTAPPLSRIPTMRSDVFPRSTTPAVLPRPTSTMAPAISPAWSIQPRISSGLSSFAYLQFERPGSVDDNALDGTRLGTTQLANWSPFNFLAGELSPTNTTLPGTESRSRTAGRQLPTRPISSTNTPRPATYLYHDAAGRVTSQSRPPSQPPTPMMLPETFVQPSLRPIPAYEYDVLAASLTTHNGVRTENLVDPTGRAI